MKSTLEKRNGKTPRGTTIAEQTAVIDALASSIEDALERDPKLKDCLVVKAARAHLKGLKELRAEQITDEANASKQQRSNGNGTSRHSH